MNYVKKFSKINPNKPFLFSYRRCPYAMRARMALLSANISFDAYEISLRDKPLELLKLSPKGTVPVLLYKKQIIDESLEIMLWAYTNSEYSNHLKILNQIQRVDANRLLNGDLIRPRTSIENLYLTGQDIVTMGITGAMMAGIMTANVVMNYDNMIDIIKGNNIVKELMKRKKFK